MIQEVMIMYVRYMSETFGESVVYSNEG